MRVFVLPPGTRGCRVGNIFFVHPVMPLTVIKEQETNRERSWWFVVWVCVLTGPPGITSGSPAGVRSPCVRLLAASVMECVWHLFSWSVADSFLPWSAHIGALPHGGLHFVGISWAGSNREFALTLSTRE
ncbi:unnamed protein product [Scytosiphon promiscuus]